MGLAVIGALLVWQAGDVKLGLVVMGGFAVAFALFGAAAFGALRLITAWEREQGVTWRYGLANMRAPREQQRRAGTRARIGPDCGASAEFYA